MECSLSLENEQFYWIFINLKHQIKSKKMSQSRADKMVFVLHPNEVSEWLAWCPLFRDWIPLQNIVIQKNNALKLMIKLKEEINLQEDTNLSLKNEKTTINNYNSTTILKKNIPKDYAHLQDIIDENPLTSVDFVGEDLSLSDIPEPPNLEYLFVSESDRRGAPRYEVRLETLIMSQGKSFKTHTVNISDSGAFLEHAIPPDFANSSLEVVFYLKLNSVTEKFAVKGKVLPNRENLKYITFNITSSENKKGFERLMMLYFQGR